MPDDAVRQALEQLPHRPIISFKERCEDSYPCSWYKKHIEESFRRAIMEVYYGMPEGRPAGAAYREKPAGKTQQGSSDREKFPVGDSL